MFAHERYNRGRIFPVLFRVMTLRMARAPGAGERLATVPTVRGDCERVPSDGRDRYVGLCS